MPKIKLPGGGSIDHSDPLIAKLVQEALQARGYYHGPIDGKFGKNSKEALELAIEANKTPEPANRGLFKKKAKGKTIRELMVTIGLDENGVREKPRNSNSGPRVLEYQRATWLEGTGWAWCAAFVCWVVKEARERKGGEFDWKRPQTAGAWDFEKWATSRSGGKKAGVQKLDPKRTKIEPGDILVFTFSHIGIAVGNEKGGEVATIEGNTDAAGSREGGGVYRKTRDKSLVRSVLRIT
ncbi:MAG: CHAP domain-containing protein [Verrucomicrobiota bacterium]